MDVWTTVWYGLNLSFSYTNAKLSSNRTAASTRKKCWRFAGPFVRAPSTRDLYSVASTPWFLTTIFYRGSVGQIVLFTMKCNATQYILQSYSIYFYCWPLSGTNSFSTWRMRRRLSVTFLLPEWIRNPHQHSFPIVGFPFRTFDSLLGFPCNLLINRWVTGWWFTY